jgi:DNA-binding winged helix-turn-helix (wHTH) protein/tetratricopeptide (TPR) repeat protein
LRQKHFYEFGPFRIDAALNRLERRGDAIPLPPKAFDLLILLARNTDRVVAKTELMETLWPNTFVEEANLTQHVYTLRKALGDQPNGQPYIDTVPRRGYRLAADVREVRLDALAPAPKESSVSVVAEGERKYATVLHCRIGDAAAAVERLGASDMHALVGDLLTLAHDEVAKYEGVITQRHADGFVGVFGAPVVHEDDARRAILAGLGMQQRFRTLSRVDAVDGGHIDLRIGVSTGPLVVSRVTSDSAIEYSTVGDTTRLADLLQQLAEPDTMLISEATRRLVEPYIEIAPTDVRAAGAEAFRVVRPLSAGAARPAWPGRTLAAFVGRRHELALLGELASQARGGAGRAVGVAGEPGMGKSRLLHEFTQALTADASMTLLEGRCVSYGRLIPYLPLADLIRAYCGVGEGDAPDIVRAAIERTVRDNRLPADAGTWLLRLIGVLDQRNAVDAHSPEAIKARTFDALRSLLFKASTRAPMVVAVEDVQWIDRTSEEFLTTLIEKLVSSRILVLVTYRPGYRVPWLDRSYATQVTLTPLPAADGAQLVDSVAPTGSLPAQVAAAIVDRAEGNPFFLEELARSVADHAQEARSIPATVQGVIMARIDRLPDTAKQLLQTASVLGREVSLSLLTRVWGGRDVAAELTELYRLEFLYERPGNDEPIVVFKHALTQDVAYDSLLARSRQQLHLRAAEALTAAHGDAREDLAATFAYHYARTDLVDQAVTWLMRAADQAARVYANVEAMLHLDLAGRRLQRLPEGPDRDRRMLGVALRQAHSLYFLGRFRESVDVLLPHAARVARLDDPALAASFSFWLAHMYSRLGDQRRAAESAQRAIDAATRANDVATLGKAHGLLALEGHWSGNTVAGIQHGATAVELLTPLADQRWWLGMAHFYTAVNHLLAGDFDRALAAAARADATGREIGDPRLQTYAGYATGWIEASRGNATLGVAACRESLERAPDRVSRAYASLFLSFALLEAGESGEARDRLETTLAELEGFGFPQWQALAAIFLGDAHRRSGRFDDSYASIVRGIEIAVKANYLYAVGVGERIGGRLARDRGDHDQSRAAFERALAVFQAIGATFEGDRTRREVAGASA